MITCSAQNTSGSLALTSAVDIVLSLVEISRRVGVESGSTVGADSGASSSRFVGIESVGTSRTGCCGSRGAGSVVVGALLSKSSYSVTRVLSLM